MTIGMRIDPEEQTVDPGVPAVFTIHVVNQSGVVDRVALDVLGSAAAWSTTDPPAVALFPGTDGVATLTIVAPLGTALGPVPLGVRATAETSGYVEVGEATLNVGASRSVEAELRPRTATGKRRATSVVFLRNLGNAPTKVQVVASDPDDAIVFDAPSAVQIGPGMTAEVPLRMGLPSREKQGATLPYTVLVEGGDTGQALDGQVRQPPKKRWPVMALAMAALLAVAAIMFLRPVDSVAIKDGTADTTTTTAAATTTTAAPAAAPAPGAPDPAAAAAAAAAAAGAAGAAANPAAAAPAAPAAGGGGGGGAPAPAPAAQTTTTVRATGGVFIPKPTTGSTTCPAAGSAQQTAQRVVCLWGTGQSLSGAPVTQAGVDALNKLTKAGNQTVSGQSGSVVTFNCSPGRGVKSVTVNANNQVDIPIVGC